MSVNINKNLHDELAKLGVNCLHPPNSYSLPANTLLEPPCSLKWMRAEYALELGAFSYAVSGYFFNASIKRYSSLGEGIEIGRHSHPLDFCSTSPVLYRPFSAALGLDQHYSLPDKPFKVSRAPTILKKTVIGNDVYVGHQAMIMPGVTLGDGCVVGARSVVTKDVPPYAIVAGAPAQIKRFRFNETTVERLCKSQWWRYSPKQLQGLDIAEVEQFLDYVENLNANPIQPYYLPEKINISKISN